MIALHPDDFFKGPNSFKQFRPERHVRQIPLYTHLTRLNISGGICKLCTVVAHVSRPWRGLDRFAVSHYSFTPIAGKPKWTSRCSVHCPSPDRLSRQIRISKPKIWRHRAQSRVKKIGMALGAAFHDDHDCDPNGQDLPLFSRVATAWILPTKWINYSPSALFRIAVATEFRV